MAVITGARQIEAFRLTAARGAIRLEKLGMRHSSGKSMRKAWAVHLGLKPTATAEQVIEAIDGLLFELTR